MKEKLKDELEIVALTTSDLKELIDKAVKTAVCEVLAEFFPTGEHETNESKLYSCLLEAEFYSHADLVDIAEGLGINPNSAKVSITRLVEKRKILKVGRGRYFIPRKD
jgi:hypothetical protein